MVTRYRPHYDATTLNCECQMDEHTRGEYVKYSEYEMLQDKIAMQVKVMQWWADLDKDNKAIDDFLS